MKSSFGAKAGYHAIVENGLHMSTEATPSWFSKQGYTLDRRMIEMVLNFIRDYTPYIVAKVGGLVDLGPFAVYPSFLGPFSATNAE